VNDVNRAEAGERGEADAGAAVVGEDEEGSRRSGGKGRRRRGPLRMPHMPCSRMPKADVAAARGLAALKSLAALM